MADDNHQRPFGSNDRYGRAAPKSASGNDPLAELARLIGQTDPFAEFGRQQQPQRAQPSHEQSWGVPGEGVPSVVPVVPNDSHYGYEQAPQPQHVQPQFAQPGYESAPAGAPDFPTYDSNYYYDDNQAGVAAGEDGYDDVPPARRRIGVVAIAAVLAIAVVGTAGAFGYRALFGSSGSSPPKVITADPGPSKVVPASKSEPQANKQIYDRVGERSAGEKLVSREEQPLERPQPPITANPLNAASAAQQAVAVPPAPVGMAGTEPKKVRTIAIKPDQPQGIDDPPPAAASPPPRAAPAAASRPAPMPQPPQQRVANAPRVSTADAEDAAPPAPRQAAPRAAAPSRNAPLSLNPNAPAAAASPPQPAPTRTASVPPRAAPEPAGNGQYAVQVSSQRSEAEAQAAFRSLQAKFPSQLGSRSPLIRRADLGDKGVYYRALVGPFASGSEASELCQSLKSAGGSCIIQKN